MEVAKREVCSFCNVDRLSDVIYTKKLLSHNFLNSNHLVSHSRFDSKSKKMVEVDREANVASMETFAPAHVGAKTARLTRSGVVQSWKQPWKMVS
jgi:hypothetical protein